MQIVNKQKMSDCKSAGMEIFSLLKSRKIKMISCGVVPTGQGKGLATEITLHISEKNKNHSLPSENKGFEIKYKYAKDPELL
jgi:hypothetical protein